MKSSLRLLPLLLAFALGIGALVAANFLGWVSVIGVKTESSDSQVIQAIERTEEVSLVSLSIQGLADDKKCRTVLGNCAPGTTKKVFLQYEFRAKLGIDGADVKVTKTGESAFRISIPAFSFIGYDQPTFKVATESGGLLSGVTPDIDRTEMINKVLNDKAQAKYLASNRDILEDQTEVFYDRLIRSIDPGAVTEFEYQP